MNIIKTSKSRFEELIKNPLFFIEKVDKSEYNEQGALIENIYWRPTSSYIDAYIKLDKSENDATEHLLAIIEHEVNNSSEQAESKEQHKDFIEFSIHIANSKNIHDWITIINSYIIRSKNTDDKFQYMHLLWFLNHIDWDVSQLKKVLECYDVKSRPFIIRGITKISRCLSFYKQRQIKEALESFNFEYTIYFPSIISEALNNIVPYINSIYLNIFNLIDYIFEYDTHDYLNSPEERIEQRINYDTDNALIHLKQWFSTNNSYNYYEILKSIYPLASETTQLNIIKRYFHDVKLGNVTFNIELINLFKDNVYGDFIRYRYCIETPECPINIGIPLLCDCILTLHQTQGKSFQSFDGILDLAIQKCDVAHPNIKLGLELFLPKCNGGATYNQNFKGFIDYSIVCELNDSKLIEENLRWTIQNILNSKADRKKYYTCPYDKDSSPLLENELKKCNNSSSKGCKLFCAIQKTYSNIWSVKKEDYNNLAKIMLKDQDIEDSSFIEVNPSMFSIEKLKKHIQSISDNYLKTETNEILINSSDLQSFETKLLLDYSSAKSMRIYPQAQPFIGVSFDLFDIKSTLNETKEAFNKKAFIFNHENKEQLITEFIKKEALEVNKRVINSLKRKLQQENYNGSYFELLYNKELLRELITLYYFKHIPDKNINIANFKFLERKKLKAFVPFCAPELADVHNQATDLPFFWCWGNECFRNNLRNQSIQTCESWQSYSLFHLIEIIGFPKLHINEGEYEPDRMIVEFINTANRVLKKFKRLKCRECDHLMFTDKSSGFNRYNYYSCINPTCKEFNIPIYLSYCFKCKKGLIDSRDNNQCPNGWYICPTCLSCCNDQQYERQAQRYILSHKPIPERIKSKLGQGHNDKGIFFCPKCGEQVLEIIDNHDGKHKQCSKCRERFSY